MELFFYASEWKLPIVVAEQDLRTCFDRIGHKQAIDSLLALDADVSTA